jgi:hypothetical protein
MPACSLLSLWRQQRHELGGSITPHRLSIT